MKKIKIVAFVAILFLLPSLSYAQFTKAEIEKANTGMLNTELSGEEKWVIIYLNLARLDGRRFFDTYFKKYIEYYNKNFDSPINANNPYLISCKQDLYRTKNLPPLKMDQRLVKAARYHARDMGKTGKLGHDSSNGKSFDQRIDSFLAAELYAGENCDYGFADPLYIVCDLLLDLDEPGVGHRRNILDAGYHKVGTAIAPHIAYQTNCVIDFSE